MEISDTQEKPFSPNMIAFGAEVYAPNNLAMTKYDFLFNLPFSWRENRFDYDQFLKERKNGIFLEIAGPTETWELVGPEELEHFFISNLYPDPSLDLIVDARDLPLEDSSLDGLYVSCLGNEAAVLNRETEKISEKDQITQLLFKEAIRALKPKGILVYQGGFRYIVDQAIKEGFQLVQYERVLLSPAQVDGFTLERWNCIFQKT